MRSCRRKDEQTVSDVINSYRDRVNGGFGRDAGKTHRGETSAPIMKDKQEEKETESSVGSELGITETPPTRTRAS